MQQANLQNVPRMITRGFWAVLVWGLVLIAGSAEADKSEPTEAEQRWINAFYKFVETGEAPVAFSTRKSWCANPCGRFGSTRNSLACLIR
jgi:hypothetical protein